MRKLLMIAVVVAASAAWLQAQSSETPGKDSSNAKGSGRQATIQGCLQSSGGHYTLTKDDGKMVDLRGDAKLSRYVGHEVQITGTRSVRTSDTTQEGTASTATERPAIQVQNAKEISSTCKSGSQ